jgi:S1 RNA binding domain protein
MQLKENEIVEGVITGVAKFGLFIDVGAPKSGLVHISEVSYQYIEELSGLYKVGDKVKVKVLTIGNDGKISLSIRQTEKRPERKPMEGRSSGKPTGRPSGNPSGERNFSRKPQGKKPFPPRNREYKPATFEDKLEAYLKDSNERNEFKKKPTRTKRGYQTRD